MTYSLLLILYTFGILGYILGSFFSLYHIYKFGFMSSTTRYMIITYLVVSLVIFLFSGWYIVQVDWSQDLFPAGEESDFLIN